MRVRPRLLRRFRSPRAPSVVAGTDAAAPHVRLLADHLVADDAWIDALAAGQADALPGPDTLDRLDQLDSLDQLDDLDALDDGLDALDDAADVVVELRRSPVATTTATGSANPPRGRSQPASTALDAAPDDGVPVSEIDALRATGGRNLPARSIERLVFELAVRNEIVAQRVERIERRLDELADQVFEAATQCDLIEVEGRRARLAAEVARLAVELRAEIDSSLTRLAREMAGIAAQRGEVDAAPPRPISPLISLSDLAELDTLPGDVLNRPGPFAASG